MERKTDSVLFEQTETLKDVLDFCKKNNIVEIYRVKLHSITIAKDKDKKIWVDLKVRYRQEKAK